MKRAVIFFATGNPHKVEEARNVLKNYPLDVKQLDIKGVEIQAESVDEVAKDSAHRAAKEHKIPIIVEDTGLSIDALNGFPGPYAAYIHETIGNAGILKLLKGVDNRRAVFQSAVAFCSPEVDVRCFIGECGGRISLEERGSHGFGFDPIFEPDEGDGRTFGEMGLEEKTAMSHRSRALRKFADWYVKRLNI